MGQINYLKTDDKPTTGNTHHHILYGICWDLLDGQPVETLLLILLARSLAPPLLPSLHVGACPGYEGQVLETIVHGDSVLVDDLPLRGDAATVALPGGER